MSKYKITSSVKNKNLVNDIIDLERMKANNPNIKKGKETKKPKKPNNDPYVRKSELQAELKPIKEKMETMVTYEELNKMEERINIRIDNFIEEQRKINEEQKRFNEWVKDVLQKILIKLNI